MSRPTPPIPSTGLLDGLTAYEAQADAHASDLADLAATNSAPVVVPARGHDTATTLFVLRGIADFVERHNLTVLGGELSTDGLAIDVSVADFLRVFPTRHTRYPTADGFRYIALLEMGSVRAMETADEAQARNAASNRADAAL